MVEDLSPSENQVNSVTVGLATLPPGSCFDRLGQGPGARGGMILNFFLRSAAEGPSASSGAGRPRISGESFRVPLQ